MAILNKTKEILPFIPGYVVYMRGDKMIVRAKGSVDKKRRNTDPAFTAVRRNNTIFAQAATLNKCIRRAFPSLIGTFGDSTLHGRLQKCCYEIIKQYVFFRVDDSKERSIAAFTLKNYAEPLLGFCLGKTQLSSVCMPQDLKVAMDAKRQKLKWDLSIFKESGLVATPAKATHVRFLLGGLKVPPEEIVFEGETMPGIFGEIVYKEVLSGAIALDTFSGTELPLCLKLDSFMKVGKHDSLLAVSGILFYKGIGKELVLMAEDCAVGFVMVDG